MTKLIIAIDPVGTPDFNLVSNLRDECSVMKFGPAYCMSAIVTTIPDSAMLDFKLHDTPETVYRAVSTLMEYRPRIITLHAAGGDAMMRAAVRATEQLPDNERPLLAVITLLTSLDDGDLRAMGCAIDTVEYISRMARRAYECGIKSVVCAGEDVLRLQETFHGKLKLIVPGIRMIQTTETAVTVNAGQKRVSTPEWVRDCQVDFAVVGRPITEAPNPIVAARMYREALRSQE